MTLTTYFLYVAAVALLVLTPGPTMLMCVTNAINHGRRHATVSAVGSITAVLGLMLLSSMGVGALLAASETGFTIVKAAGAAYLIWLGVKTFRDGSAPDLTQIERPPARSAYRQGLIVGASNPKALLFFAAFLPQFISPAEPVAGQLAVLALTFATMEFTVLTSCAFGASRLTRWIKSAKSARWINRVCGGLFGVMGGLLLFTRRHA